ncbi:MAG: hypothetical protein FJ044_01855 [Candidatus Cloacimonetes bacterium]|nr:hypothetical protein [Candidatus Cloacimonadota bacterium]
MKSVKVPMVLVFVISVAGAAFLGTLAGGFVAAKIFGAPTELACRAGATLGIICMLVGYDWYCAR